MKNENVNAFHQAVSASEEVQNRLIEGEDWVQISKELGTEITAAEALAMTIPNNIPAGGNM